MRFLERFTEPIYAVFRIVFGLLFASHGAEKVFGMFGGHKADALPTIAAGWFEIIAGLLIAIGLFTALVALLASIEMAGAAIIFHGEVSVLYCFAFLYMAARVPGLWSVDRMRGKPATAAS
jgi:putative oxidoreductase